MKNATSMKKIKIEISDKGFNFINPKNTEISGNIFTAVHTVRLEDENLDTFFKRLKWLIKGKLQ